MLKIILQEKKTRIRLTSQAINILNNKQAIIFNQNNSLALLNHKIILQISDTFSITQQSDSITINIDNKTISECTSKKNLKNGVFIEKYNFYIQQDLKKSQTNN